MKILCKYFAQYFISLAKVCQVASSSNLASALFFNTFLFVLFFTFFTPQFETNDDLAMMRIAAGQFLGEPSEYLFFINILIGKALQFLYIHLPLYNWYVLMFYVLHFIAMSAILYVLLNHKRSIFTYLLYLLLFVFFEIQFLARLQFTTTSFVVGVSGLLLLASMERKDYDYKKLLITIIGIFLVVTSGLIRANILYLILLLWISYINVKIIEPRTIKNVFPVIIALLIFSGAYIYNDNYYEKNSDWSFYRQYNSLRAQLTDYPYYAYNEKTQNIYEDVGWSENDVAMFRGWTYADLNKFTLNDLSYIVANIGPEGRSYRDSLVTIYRSLREIDIKSIAFTAILIFVSFIIARRDERLSLLLLGITTVAIIAYFSFYGRLPVRVLLPIIFFVCLISLSILVSNMKKSNVIKLKASVKLFGFVLFIAACLFTSTMVFIISARESMQRLDEFIEFNVILKQMANEDYVFITQPGKLSNQNLAISFYNFDNNVIDTVAMGGWPVPSPIYYEKLSQYEIENLFFDVIYRRDLLMLSSESQMGRYRKYMFENYDMNIICQPYLVLENDSVRRTAYQIYQVYTNTDILKALEAEPNLPSKETLVDSLE